MVLLGSFIEKIFLHKKKEEMSRKSPPFFSIRVPEAEEASVAVRWKARWAVSQKVEVVELKGV